MGFEDAIISAAYLLLPVQFAVLYIFKYPCSSLLPFGIKLLIALFSMFFFLCGICHGLEWMGASTESTLYLSLNRLNALTSIMAALYLIPILPRLLQKLDSNVRSVQTLNEELEISKRKLLTFMAFLCHEIRNPLFVITSNISFLEDLQDAQNLNSAAVVQPHSQHEPLQSPPQQQQQQYQQPLHYSNQPHTDSQEALQAISQSADLMLRLVNDVLDISNLEAGKLALQEQDFDLRGTLEGVAKSMERFVYQKHGGAVVMRTHIDDAVPPLVHADAARLLQIISNLLSNANKFTQHGSIVFQVSLAERQQVATLPGATAYAAAHCCDSSEHSETDADSTVTLLEQGERTSGQSQRLQKLSSFREAKLVCLKIRVQDTGMGISPEQLEHLFQPYAQSKLSNYRQQGGTGLGLAIVGKLCATMGGKVCVASQVGRGTTFDAYIVVKQAIAPTSPSSKLPHTSRPIEQQQQQRQQQQQTLTTHKAPLFQVPNDAQVNVPLLKPLPPPAEGETPLVPIPPTPLSPVIHRKLPQFDQSTVVLVVDDNEMNRKILQRMLGQMNLNSLLASDGQEALNILYKSHACTQRSQDPLIGLVLMDLSMPVMDGYQATRAIRSNPVFCDLPVVALTAGTTREGEERIIKAGCTEYQTKPIRRDELYQVCQRHLLGTSYCDTAGTERFIDPAMLV